jgi:hypothetical protein
VEKGFHYLIEQALLFLWKYICSSLYIILKDDVKVLCLSPNECGIPGRHIVVSTVPVYSSGQITEQEAAATQPRPNPHSQAYMFFLMHTSKGWCKHFMCMAQ